MKCKLVYFDAMGRAEVLRMILKFKQVDFEDQRLSFEEWNSLKPDVKSRGLPIFHLEDEVTTLHTSGAILRYLAEKYNLNGENPLDRARIEMHSNLLEQVYGKLPFFETDAKTKAEKMVRTHMDEILPVLQQMEKLLAENNNIYFIHNKYKQQKLSYVDLVLAHYLLITEQYLPSLLSYVPLLDDLKYRVTCLPGINKYLSERATTVF